MVTYLKPGPAPSVEHFYHFVVQYLLPLFEKELTDGVVGKGYVVRDCGPMNVWFDFVFGPDAFTIMSREKFRTAPAWRFWDRYIQMDTFADSKGLLIDVTRFRDVVTAFREKFVPGGTTCDTVTVLDRGLPPAYYLNGSAEKAGGGSIRRSISNLDKLSQMISERKPVNLVDFAEMSPADQMEAISRTTVLIGQHGAGLLQSIFVQEDAPLVELKDTTKPKMHFRILAESLGREYRAFYLDERHATLSPQMLNEIVDYVVDRA
jgi:hypothetical protein